MHKKVYQELESTGFAVRILYPQPPYFSGNYSFAIFGMILFKMISKFNSMISEILYMKQCLSPSSKSICEEFKLTTLL